MNKNPQAQFWAVLLIIIGAALLLGRLIGDLSDIFWALLLIGLGFYLLVGRNLLPAAEVKTERFVEPLEGASSARVDLNLSMGRPGKLDTLADSENLLDAEVSYTGEIVFEAMGDAERAISLRQTKTDVSAWLDPLNWFNQEKQGCKWHVSLNPNVPTSLSLDVGASKSEIDLRHLTVTPQTELRIHTGAGSADIVLPDDEQGYTAQIENGAGELRVAVPDGATVGTSMKCGLGKVTLRVGMDAAVNAHVKGGVGSATIQVPREAAVRIEGSTGVGNVSLPDHFVQQSGESHTVGQSGVWQTPNYDEADRQITIAYEGGVGALNIQTA
jgi:hypothetical protein